MIDYLISILVSSGKITNLARELKSCSTSLGGIFEADDSRLKLKKNYLSDDPESYVNLILTPDDDFVTLFQVEAELAEVWYILNGMHYFQMGQFFRFREATIFRFVTTIFTHSAVTGTIILTGEKYTELSREYAANRYNIDSWIDTKAWEKFHKEI